MSDQRMRNYGKLALIISDCERVHEDNRSFSTDISSLNHVYHRNLNQIGRRIKTEHYNEVKEEFSLKECVELHKYLNSQIMNSPINQAVRNSRASKYIKRESTEFDRNPVIYLRKQLEYQRKKSNKLSILTKQFLIRQQKFQQSILRINNY